MNNGGTRSGDGCGDGCGAAGIHQRAARAFRGSFGRVAQVSSGLWVRRWRGGFHTVTQRAYLLQRRVVARSTRQTSPLQLRLQRVRHPAQVQRARRRLLRTRLRLVARRDRLRLATATLGQLMFQGRH
eukprot:1197569-Prymnesium_polylepis.1